MKRNEEKLSISDFDNYIDRELANAFQIKQKRLFTRTILTPDNRADTKFMVEYREEEDIKTKSTSYLCKAIKWYNEIE